MHDAHREDLDPRRRPRGQRFRRDWASMTSFHTLPRLHDLLASLLVRLGVTR